MLSKIKEVSLNGFLYRITQADPVHQIEVFKIDPMTGKHKHVDTLIGYDETR